MAKTKKEVEGKAFEVKPAYSGRRYKIEAQGQGFIILMDQGSGFRPCGKFGLWDEPFIYRNLKLAEECLAIFESQCKKF